MGLMDYLPPPVNLPYDLHCAHCGRRVQGSENLPRHCPRCGGLLCHSIGSSKPDLWSKGHLWIRCAEVSCKARVKVDDLPKLYRPTVKGEAFAWKYIRKFTEKRKRRVRKARTAKK